MYNYIKSDDNINIKKLKSLHQKKYRKKYSLFFAEGIKVISESLEYVKPSIIVINQSVIDNEEIKAVVQSLVKCKIFVVTESIFRNLCDTESPQGIIAYYSLVHSENLAAIKAGHYMFLDGISDPGNLGSIIRSAEAFGIKGIILRSNCVDLYSPKVIRATMASIFRSNIFIIEDISALSDLKHRGFKLFSSTIEEARDVQNVDFGEKSVTIIGKESQGVSKEVEEIADEKVTINMAGTINSLNASMAATIFMYEIFRHSGETIGRD